MLADATPELTGRGGRPIGGAEATHRVPAVSSSAFRRSGRLLKGTAVTQPWTAFTSPAADRAPEARAPALAGSKAASTPTLEDASGEHIVEGIRAVATSEVLESLSVTRRLLERFADGRGRSSPSPAELDDTPAELDELTRREREVLEIMARGLSNAELAERLYLSEKTIKTHVSRIFTKLGLRDRVQAVILAYEAGIVVPGRD